MSMLATVLGACLRKGHTGMYFRGNHIYPTCLMVLLLLFETSTGEYFYFRNTAKYKAKLRTLSRDKGYHYAFL